MRFSLKATYFILKKKKQHILDLQEIRKQNQLTGNEQNKYNWTKCWPPVMINSGEPPITITWSAITALCKKD